MDKIKFISIKDPTNFFELPYEWLPAGTQGPTLNDLEQKAERGSTTAYLVRIRSGEVPAATLDICKRLTRQCIERGRNSFQKLIIYDTYNIKKNLEVVCNAGKSWILLLGFEALRLFGNSKLP